jgi:AI-2 transport protein TqsA
MGNVDKAGRASGGAASSESRVQTVSLFILAIVAGGFALHWMQGVIIPFVLAIFFSIALRPIVELLMQRLRVPRFIAVLLTFMLGLLIILVLASLISTSVGRLDSGKDTYKKQITALLAKVTDKLPLERWNIDEDKLAEKAQAVATDALESLFGRTVTSLLTILSQGMLVLIFLLFLLLGVPEKQGEAKGLRGEVQSQIKLYIITKFTLSVITGILVWLALLMLNIPLAFVFGLFAFLLNFVPSIGSVIATLLPLPVVLISPGISPAYAVMAIAIPGAIQFAVGNVIEPRIMGKSFNLHPVTILLALIFWGTLWGIVGMLLATPITAALKILLSRMEMTRPVAEIMAGNLTSLERETPAPS